MKAQYKRMIQGMKANSSREETWFLYILECGDGTYYTGVTKNLERRLSEHNTGKGARYTRTRAPLRILYQEKCLNRSEALIREYAIKTLSRLQKKELIENSLK